MVTFLSCLGYVSKVMHIFLFGFIFFFIGYNVFFQFTEKALRELISSVFESKFCFEEF